MASAETRAPPKSHQKARGGGGAGQAVEADAEGLHGCSVPEQLPRRVRRRRGGSKRARRCPRSETPRTCAPAGSTKRSWPRACRPRETLTRGACPSSTKSLSGQDVLPRPGGRDRCCRTRRRIRLTNCRVASRVVKLVGTASAPRDCVRALLSRTPSVRPCAVTRPRAKCFRRVQRPSARPRRGRIVQLLNAPTASGNAAAGSRTPACARHDRR